MRGAGRAAALLAVLLASACADGQAQFPWLADAAAPESTPGDAAADGEAATAEMAESAPPDSATSAEAVPEEEAAVAADVPQIYMALQPDPAGPVSVILTIDRSRDGTPADDPAIRLTPVNGQCNPQQLRWYDFAPDQARAPAYGPAEAARGITARDLPDYMASMVTSEMMAEGLIDAEEESRPQHVCTRKLLQRIIIDSSSAGA